MAKSFFAYPSQPVAVADTIRAGLKILRDDMRMTDFHGWEQIDIAGHFIIDPILAEINDCDFLAADITKLNFNVAYEIGYAIGRSRRLVLTKDEAFTGDDALIREVGIFDTIGYRGYQDSRQLASILSSVNDFRALQTAHAINKHLPVYLVLPKTRTDREVHLVSRTKKPASASDPSTHSNRRAFPPSTRSKTSRCPTASSFH